MKFQKYTDTSFTGRHFKHQLQRFCRQSSGAFSAHGLTFTVEGNTNDYLGKGLSGAKLIIKKPAKASFVAENNIIVGNVSLFGAIEGQAFINGIAGERFAVRNSRCNCGCGRSWRSRSQIHRQVEKWLFWVKPEETLPLV